MGNCCCCCSRLNAKLVLPHELRVGDHILIQHCYGDVNAIFVDDEKNRCIYLDNITGYVTETYLQTLCNDTNKLFRYDYSTTTTMSPQQTVANSKYFSLRGKFSKFCLISSGYQFAFNCKVNKYISINNGNNIDLSPPNDQDSLLINIDRNGLITADALTLCMDNMDNISTSNENSAGGASKDHTQKILDIKPSITMQIDRIYDKLQSMDDEIKSIKNIQNDLLDQDADQDENVIHQSGLRAPLNSVVSSKKDELHLSPITMDTSVTLTPIRSETGNPGGNTLTNYGRNLGVIVVPDIQTSTSIGGQFSVVDSSMSMSTTTKN